MAKSKPKKIKQEIIISKNEKVPKYIALEIENPHKTVVNITQKTPHYKNTVNQTDRQKIENFFTTHRQKNGDYDWAKSEILKILDDYPKHIRLARLNAVWNLFSILEKKRCFEIVKEDSYVKGLFEIAIRSENFVREPKDWKRTSHNTTKQFVSLIKHLFVKYEVPTCLYEAWHNVWDSKKREKYLEWFIKLTNGASVRFLRDFPVKITPKIGHYFMKAPDYLDVDGAIRYAQVLANGGDEYLAWYINSSYLGRNSFTHEDFWETVITFFAKIPMFDAEKLPEIVDYLEHQRRQNRDFSMKGRTINALLRQSEEWHTQTALERAIRDKMPSKNAVWEKSPIFDFQKEEGNFEKGNNFKRFTIRELLSVNALQKEGSAMNHCVASYASKCIGKHTAIFALEVGTYYDEIVEKMVTLEIDLRKKQLVQAKGKYNRLTTEKERNIINLWLNENQIEKSKWISW